MEKDTYTYQIDGNLYINLTNRCSNRCTFCVREERPTYEGYSLWLKGGEPTVQQVIDEIPDPTAYREVVFCGFGEPTYRLEELLAIADHLKAKGGRTRLNTNGQGNLIHGCDIAPLLRGKLDGVNISLNAPTKEAYNKLCRPSDEQHAFSSVLSFAKCCKAASVNCWFSVVDCIGNESVNECRKLSDSVGIPLRVRQMIL
jgi:TatD DNase family protein